MACGFRIGGLLQKLQHSIDAVDHVVLCHVTHQFGEFHVGKETADVLKGTI